MKSNKELLASLLENVVAVMVDEAHGAKANVLQSMLNGPFAKVPYRWGFTGTSLISRAGASFILS
jgi:type I site-specific restriction-modification system R (restriction) subunit